MDFICGGFPWGAAGEKPEFNIKPPLGAPLLIFPRGYLLKSFPQVDTSARQQGFEIRVFPLLGELPKAIVVAALRVDFPWESQGPATCGFACNCPEPEAWTMVASGQ